MKKNISVLTIASILFFICCTKNKDVQINPINYEVITKTFGTKIDLINLFNYTQKPPLYILKDNARGFTISNEKATLGRVLFYDKSLSIDNTLSCASCHKQQFAFSDTAIASDGVLGGLTGRHSMRLINNRYAEEAKYFWDERAATLEIQSTMPIKEHSELGFSGQSGRPAFSALLTKLQSKDYYNELFQYVYGDTVVTESRMQECLSHFLRSIISYDSKYDEGRSQVANDLAPFPNFTAQENNGKNIFITPPIFDAGGVRVNGGFGCGGCHRAPEFDIDPNSKNNGIIGVLNNTGFDLLSTKAPSLRDLVNGNGEPNGPMMHTGVIKSVQTAIGHYGTINAGRNNTNLDPRLMPNGVGQQLNVTAQEVNAVIAFIKTLSGKDVYTNPKYSNPF